MNTKLYVGNIPYDVAENDLETLFSDYGAVTDVFLLQDRMTGRSRGFAFVTMSNKQESQAAIDGLNGKDWQGRALVVNEARPREERPAFSEDRGGGGKKGGGRPYRR